LDARLLEAVGAGRDGQVRYRFHDLVRAYARERAHAEEPAAERANALRRALGAWLALAHDADDRLPLRPVTRGGDEIRTRPADPPGDPVAWFEDERACLVAGVAQAAAAGFADLAWRLAASLPNFFDLRALYDDWRYTHEVALEACRGAGDRLGEAV